MALRLIKKAVKEEMPVFDRKTLNQALMTLDGEPAAFLFEIITTGRINPSNKSVK